MTNSEARKRAQERAGVVGERVAVDHAARIAEVLAEHVGWPSERYLLDRIYYVGRCDCGWEERTTDEVIVRGSHDPELHRAHVAEALVAAGIGVLPEAEVTGILAPSCPHCEWQRPPVADLPENYAAAKRDVVAHKADCPGRVAEWEAVDDPTGLRGGG